ncbi:MAG: type II secretion system protein GspL [Alteromonadaceae bacterium]|nr:type II secretion system protein GspL [Alteromonadaceae bacterium]
MEKLVVRLGQNNEDTIHWLLWSESEQEIRASGELENTDSLSSLKDRTGQDSLIALVPGSNVTLKQVNLPPKASRKALLAIPFMLEDEVLGDIEDQFIVLNDREGDQQEVLVVAHANMQKWLETIKEAGFHCEKMLPDALCLPSEEGTWHALGLGTDVLLRLNKWEILTGETQWLPLAIANYSKQQEDKLKIVFSSEPQLHNIPNAEIEHQPSDLPMQILAMEAITSKLTLLQEQYKPKKRGGSKRAQWRMAAALGATALLLTFVDKGIEASRLQTQQDQLRSEIMQEFKRAFPEVTRVRDVKRTMQQRISQLESGGSGISMLVMMSQLSNAFSSSAVKPQSIRFDSRRTEIRLQAVADNFEALENFKRQVEAKGFTVEQGAINNRDSQVVGSLAIRS